MGCLNKNLEHLKPLQDIINVMKHTHVPKHSTFSIVGYMAHMAIAYSPNKLENDLT